jgi:hypothetical protein
MLSTSLGIVVWARTIVDDPFCGVTTGYILNGISITKKDRLTLLNKATKRSWCWPNVDSHHAPAISDVPNRATVTVPRPLVGLLSL